MSQGRWSSWPGNAWTVRARTWVHVLALQHVCLHVCEPAARRSTAGWPVTVLHGKGHDGHGQPVPQARDRRAADASNTVARRHACGKNRRPVTLRNSQNPTCPSALPGGGCSGERLWEHLKVFARQCVAFLLDSLLDSIPSRREKGWTAAPRLLWRDHSKMRPCVCPLSPNPNVSF